MNSEKFAEITARCQPHPVFSSDWTHYYSDDFADSLLPEAGIIKGKSLRFYDGAGIVPLTSSFPQHYMKLSTNDQIVSLIFFSYPKGVTAGEKVEGIRLGHDELCAFFEIEKNDSINVRLKAGADFKKILHSIAADDHSKDISKNIDTLEFETSLSKFQAFFKPEISHYAMLSFVGFITGADLVKKHNKTVPGIKLHDLEAYTSEPADNKKRRVKEEQRLQLKIGFTVTNTAIHHCVLTVTHKGKVIHCSTYLSAVTCAGQKTSEIPITALQNELQALESSELPPKDEILPPDDYYLYWDCTDFISQQAEIGELLITMKVVTAEGNSETLNYPKANVKKLFQNAKENNYIIILDANDEEVQVFGASIIDRQTRFIKRIAEIYDTLSDKHKLILHLPEIMVKLGWLHGALCQIHWLEGSKTTLKFPYEFFMSEERVENIDKIKLEEYFKGIRYISHTNTENLSYMPSNPDGDNFFLYNEKFEEVKKSLNLFLENLEKKADFIVIGGNEKLKQNISDKVLPVNENYFQAFSIGNSAAVLDDLGAAVGRCIMRCFYQGDLHKDSENDNWTLFVLRVKCQFHDEFNFIDEVNPRNTATWISQPLGFWPDDIVSSNERSLSTKDLILKVVKEIAKALTIHTSDLSYLDNASFRDLKNIIQNDKNKIRPSCEDFFIDSPLKTLDNEFLAKIIPVF